MVKIHKLLYTPIVLSILFDITSRSIFDVHINGNAWSILLHYAVNKIHSLKCNITMLLEWWKS